MKYFLFVSLLTYSGLCQAHQDDITITSPQYEPFVTVNTDGSVDGLVTRIVEASFAANSLKVDFQITPFSRSMYGLIHGNYEVGFFDEHTLNSASDKKQSCHSFFRYNSVLFQNTSKPVQAGEHLLVGMLRGNPHEKAALENLGYRILEVSNHKSLILMLASKRIDLMSTVQLTGYQLIRKHTRKENWEKFQVFNEPFYRGKAGLCFSQSADTTTQKIFAKGLKALKKSGRYRSLVMNYLENLLGDEKDDFYAQNWD